MKKMFVIFAVGAGLALGGFVFAEENAVEQTQAAPAEVGNKICPISGEKIKAGEEVKHEYNGKIYNFCCKMCVKDFQKNPEKFSKAAEEEAKTGAASTTDATKTESTEDHQGHTHGM